MQILSIVQWYHFAYMVISVALLGFGAAGTFLAIFRKRLVASAGLLPFLMFLCAAAMAMVVEFAQWSSIRFDSYLVFAERSHIGRLFFTYLLFFLPFFCGALAVGLSFVKHVDQIGRLYFANLSGSGLGGLIALGFMGQVVPQKIPAFIAILALIAGVLLFSKHRRGMMSGAILLTGAVIVLKIVYPPQLVLSEFKSLSKILELPEARIIREKNSPQGFMQVVTSPALRYAPGLSLTYRQAVPGQNAAFNNGNWFGATPAEETPDTPRILDFTTEALPYVLQPRQTILDLHAAGGLHSLYALMKGGSMIVAVESHPLAGALIREEFQEYRPHFPEAALSLHGVSPRTFLFADTADYDLIHLPTVGEFGGSAGLFALQEQYLLTREALRDMWNRLTESGVISITSWMDYPVRNPLKILATIVAVLKEQGIAAPEAHICAVRSWGTITFAVKHTPLTAGEIARIRAFCETMLFDPALLPGLQDGERARYNTLQDARFFASLDTLLSGDRNSFIERYAFNIKPATDNRPYFSQFIRWKSLPRLATLFGGQTLPFFEIGYVIVILTLAQITLAAIVLILLPLFKIGWTRDKKTWTVLYFSGIGLGYMFVEIVLIQHFILYFGSPIYAAAAVISLMLICSGFGSYLSSRIPSARRALLAALVLTIIMLGGYGLLLSPLLRFTIGLPLPVKVFAGVLIIGPVAFCMGFPFPVGLKLLAETHEAQVPWAWGINGCVSVISTALATVIAVEAGFSWVMAFAALAYCLPLLVNLRET